MTSYIVIMTSSLLLSLTNGLRDLVGELILDGGGADELQTHFDLLVQRFALFLATL